MKAAFTLPDTRTNGLAASLPARFGLDFRGAGIRVAATSERAIATLRRVYQHYVVPEDHIRDPGSDELLLLEEDTSQAGAVAAALGRRKVDLDGHLLIASWLKRGLRIEGHGLLHYYSSKLLRLRVVERWLPDIVTLHAASIGGPDGFGFLLLGEAAAGKTTLTLRLIDAGFNYCADDTSCIRRADLTCLPFPMTFIVRADLATGAPRHPELSTRPPDLALLDEPRWLLDRWTAVGRPFRPTALYFVAPDGRDGAVLREMGQIDAALALLRNLVMPLGADAAAFTADPANFDLCCRLAESCRCVSVDSSNLDAAYEAITADYHDHAGQPLQVAS